MKKIISVLLCGLIIFALIGCGGSAYNIWLLKGFLDGIPKELSEAAAMMTDPDLPLGEQIQNRKLMLVFNKLAEVNIEQARHNARDARRYQLTVISLCIASLLIFITLVVFGKIRNRQHAIVQEEQQLRISVLRLQNIRNRITPHFIFNELNRAISHANDAEQYRELQELVKLLRFSLQLNEKLGVTLKEELDFVRYYLDVERKRLGPGIELLYLSTPLHMPSAIYYLL